MNNKIVVIGDVMLDRYVEGTSNRMSPEAPVPIVLVDKESYRLGGAGNVANNLTKLGVDCYLLGCIGSDDYGKTLDDLLTKEGVHNLCIQDHDTTTVKTRVISKSQHLLRIDRESHYEISNTMITHCVQELERLQPDVIVISDYAKGMITKSLMQEVQRVCPNSSILVDPKGLNWNKYGSTFLIKPNLNEFLAISGFSNINDLEKAPLQEIFNTFNTSNLLITLSDKGMMLINEKEVKNFDVTKAEVYDVTGAGDTALAVLCYGLNQKWTLEKAIKVANIASRYVVTKPKTHVMSKEELEEQLVLHPISKT